MTATAPSRAGKPGDDSRHRDADQTGTNAGAGDGRTVLGDGLAVHRLAADAGADRALELISRRLGDGASPSDIAVLARVNSALLPVQIALTDAGIAHTAPLDRTALGRTGIRTALAYLRLGLDLERIRREDILDTINRPARKVRSAVEPHLRRGGQMSIARLEQVADLLDGTHQERFAGYLGDLRHLEHAITNGADTARCLWIIRNRIGLGEAMDALDASRTRPEGSSHGDDLDALEQLAARQPDPAAFQQWLADHLAVPGDPGGVVLSTVHRVKGMEWDHVVVFATNQGLFPHRLADDVEEERRVFHVAITRCREHADIIVDTDRPSPFVAELTEEASARRTRDTVDAEIPKDVRPVRHPSGGVVASLGLEVELPGGVRGTIAAVGSDVVAIRVTDQDLAATIHVPLSTNVRLPAADPDDAAATEAERAEAAAVSDGDGAGTRSDAQQFLPLRTAPKRPTGHGADGGLLRASDAGAADIDDALYEALRTWRSRIAAEHNIPAYLVFHDRHLQMIAGRKPRTLRELADCPGVGPTKLERYGDDLLDVVDDHR